MAMQSTESISDQVSAAILRALALAVAAQELPSGLVLPDQITLERPKNRDHGDYATSIALALAKTAEMNPRAIAELIRTYLLADADIKGAVAAVDIAGPGFLNITLARSGQGSIIAAILSEGEKYGHGHALAGKSINLEFISANPTGPLHLGHTRWAAVGDALGRVLAAAGAKVTREFYINDRGNQMELFGASLRAAAQGVAVPENGYHGAYINDIAAAIKKSHPEFLALPEAASLEAFRDSGYALQLADQQRVLEDFRTHFDVWFSERSLYENDFFKHCLDRLKAQGHVYEEGGAIWLRTTDFGDDKDRVMIKSDGAFAYFASDSAYYISKRERGFDICIYMLGADHHGYVNRLKAISACAGDDPNYNIDALIGQMVKIMENGEEIKLSKRAGTIITLEELVEKVGVDAARYTLIRYPVDTPMVMDVDVLRSRTNENPVYYVQYAHARICSVLMQWTGTPADLAQSNFALLANPHELALCAQLREFPSAIEAAAHDYAPHGIAFYLKDLAAGFHGWYNAERLLVDDAALKQARLALALAVKQTLANGLKLLGVSAPESM